MANRSPRNRVRAAPASHAPSTPEANAAPFDPASRSAPAPTARQALVTTEAPEPERDAHGFDPKAYDWIPVKRQRRLNGWSDAKQRAFIESLADTCSVTDSAYAVGMSVNSCYRLRNAPDGANFARAWDAAIHTASKRLIDAAFDRALNGVEHIVFDKEGRRLGAQRRYNDRLLMFLLRANQPDRYSRAHLDPRTVDTPAPALPPVAEALVALAPVTPPDPHLLKAPERLETELQVADLMEGKLPHWHREPDPNTPVAEDAAFEARLEALKHAQPPAPDFDEDLPIDWDDEDDADTDEGDETENPFLA